MTFSITDQTEELLRKHWEALPIPRPKLSHIVENAIQDYLEKKKQ